MGTDAPKFLLDRKWPFRIAVGAWLAIGAVAWFFSDRVDRPAQVVFGSLWFVGLGLLLRQFILSLFGPVLAFDVLRVGRKPRQIWFRVAYAVLLAVIFTWIYLAWMTFDPDARTAFTRRQMSQMAETFFYTYAIIQFIIVCFLTPASLAGAIADEKERRTLEFLLATDLRDREILFGKLAARVGALLLFLMAGLPILGMLQFFGGIDPDLVIAAFVATVIVVLSLSALGMAASVLARRVRDAVALTYLSAMVYVAGSFGLWAIAMWLTYAPAWRASFNLFGYTITPEDMAYPIICGNPFYMTGTVMRARGMGGLDLFSAVVDFALFHAVAIALLVTWAGFRLRPIALKQTFGSTRPSLLRRLTSPKKKEAPTGPARAATAPVQRRAPRSSRAALAQRPEIGDSPVIWKEVFVDTGLKMGGVGRAFIILLVAISLFPVVLIFYFSIVEPSSWRYTGTYERWNAFGEGMNRYLRVTSTIVGTLLFLAMAIRGAGVVSGERDRHTLDALLTTPLSAKSIVWGKWWGCMLGLRWGWAWLFGLWVMALATGGVHPVMFPFGVLSAVAYASAFAWIGIYCSLSRGTTLRATMAAILLCAFFGGGYFLVFLFCCMFPIGVSGAARERDLSIVVDLLKGFSPPVNLAWVPIRDFDPWEMEGMADVPYAPFFAIGLIVWGLVSLSLSKVCVTKFQQLANRGETAVPPPLPKRPAAVPG
jgi:ABC-type transport system involved in multi-copper enzyme maturation permease subunit